MKLPKIIPYLFAIVTLVISHPSASQNIEHNAWLFWSHQQKISEKWRFSADVQLRSADQLDYLNTLLIRPGIGYKITDNQSITLGYTYFGTWEKDENDKIIYELENRIFEQYQIQSKIGRIELSNRIRYEQRFLQEEKDHFFAQRFRYNIQGQIPLIANAQFTKGLYASFQNELFLHVQGKEKLNNHVFNQNRTYFGIGYRLSEKLDLEADYMFRYIIEEDKNVRNNVLQVAVKTSF